MKFANIEEIEDIDFRLYRTCREQANKSELTSLVLCGVDETLSEDERWDARFDLVYEILTHQYTMYSATPLGLYLILTLLTSEQQRRNEEYRDFIESCKKSGNTSIYLTDEEKLKNLNGELLIFSIKDVLDKYA